MDCSGELAFAALLLRIGDALCRRGDRSISGEHQFDIYLASASARPIFVGKLVPHFIGDFTVDKVPEKDSDNRSRRREEADGPRAQSIRLLTSAATGLVFSSRLRNSVLKQKKRPDLRPASVAKLWISFMGPTLRRTSADLLTWWCTATQRRSPRAMALAW